MEVMAVYYRQRDLIPFFRWGIERNRDEISLLTILSDALWEPGEKEEIEAAMDGIPLRLIDVPRPDNPKWHGVGRLYNIGIANCASEYAFFTSVDQILPEDCISLISDSAAPERMVVGQVHTIHPPQCVEDLENPEVAKFDLNKEIFQVCRVNPDQIVVNMIWRNGHTLVHVPTFRDLGGFDETYCALGYGLEDYDLGARWLIQHGSRSVVAGDSFSWTIERTKRKKYPCLEAVDRFNGVLQKLGQAFNMKVRRLRPAGENEEVTA